MKIRNGFVSNSSSSSFILLLDKLSDDDLDKIYNHDIYAKEIDEQLKKENKPLKYEYYDKWAIEKDEIALHFYTNMDNFYLKDFLYDELNINHNDILFDSKFRYGDNLFKNKDYLNFKNKYLRKKKIKKIKNGYKKI